MKPHIGDMLEKVMKEKDVSPRELAKRLDVTVQTIYNLIKTELPEPFRIEQFTQALDHDFYQYAYAPPKDFLAKTESEELQKLRKENEEMKKELAYLKEINELLKKKK